MVSNMAQEMRSQLGDYLRSLRDAKGMTLRDMEERTGISNPFLSQMESGKVKHPSPVMLYKLAEAYGVPYAGLMERAGYPVPEGHPHPRSARQVLGRFGDITQDEEEVLLDYLSFLRSRKGRKR